MSNLSSLCIRCVLAVLAVHTLDTQRPTSLAGGIGVQQGHLGGSGALASGGSDGGVCPRQAEEAIAQKISRGSLKIGARTADLPASNKHAPPTTESALQRLPGGCMHTPNCGQNTLHV
jgi:hypothetical protein